MLKVHARAGSAHTAIAVVLGSGILVWPFAVILDAREVPKVSASANVLARN
jgi:hypothetical protein